MYTLLNHRSSLCVFPLSVSLAALGYRSCQSTSRSWATWSTVCPPPRWARALPTGHLRMTAGTSAARSTNSRSVRRQARPGREMAVIIVIVVSFCVGVVVVAVISCGMASWLAYPFYHFCFAWFDKASATFMTHGLLSVAAAFPRASPLVLYIVLNRMIFMQLLTLHRPASTIHTVKYLSHFPIFPSYVF